MHDNAANLQSVFTNVRPTIVTDEAESANTFAPEVIAEQAMKNVADMPMEELSPAAHRRFRAVLMGEATVDSIKLPHVTTWSVIDRASD